MGSIFDLFNVDPEAAAQEGLSEPAFDGSNLDAVLNEVLDNRPVAGRPAGYDPSTDGGASPAPTSDGEVHGAEGGEPAAPASDPPETPAASVPAATPVPPAPPVQTSDPFADMTDMERLELAQLRQALNDPDRQMNVRRAMLGVEAPPVPATPAVAPALPAATLPEEFEPGSPEAQLWESNQALQRQIAEIQQGQQTQSQQTEQEQMNGAAQRAIASFTARYGNSLGPDEIKAVAQHAGLQKLPEAFRPMSTSWDDAMTKSLDYVLRSNDLLLAKVLGAPAAPPAAGAPGDPARDATRRRLTALSSAASPSGDSPTRKPIEHRPDGKLTEQSRLALVQEMMNTGGMTGSPGEGI